MSEADWAELEREFGREIERERERDRDDGSSMNSLSMMPVMLGGF